MPILKIYIVEDSPYVRKSLVRVISEIPGVKIVGEGENVKSALEFLTKNESDVYVLDYNLPDGTGVDIIKSIKQLKLNAISVVISNIVDEPLRKSILKSGADYFFDKSNEIDDLFALLEKLANEKK
ncbi:MAG: response regulator transcription factor [Ignavibacterium album]|jgi:DNA-binding NarL/FixJ family response regulator|uniref:Response regulator n=1 Tax=Ignavibacterium album TaxID=591197 RepID=A0A7V2ZI12_9BACT|nr:response regulator transcription factor [Ignavibacterium album]MCX8104972.1 response regulator transcription factor [Ignavibacterium album]